MAVLYVLGAIVIVLLTVLYLWIKKQLNYWQSKGLDCIEPNFFFGNISAVFSQKESFGEFSKRIYSHFKSNNQKHGGIYVMFRQMYFPVDPDIIKGIMQNDFQHFYNRGVYVNEESDPLSAHLFSLEGKKWKNLRAKLTPTFTSGKLKNMFQTLVNCSDQLTIEMDKQAGKESIEIKEILARFTTDIIVSCAFGIECNSLKDPSNDFIKHGATFFEPTFTENIRNLLSFILPEIMKPLGMRAVRKQFSDFFLNVITKTVDYREKNNVHRKDFMHLMIQLKNHGKLVDEGELNIASNNSDKEAAITLNELAAQAFIFFLGGFETSSTTMTFCLYELATNQDIQEKLRKEINEVLERHDGKITYDACMEMQYMEKVINETLRKYPPLPTLNRVCTEDYPVPGTDFVVEKGTKVMIPVLALHHDEKYYPNPSKFDPERFNEENKRDRHAYTFLPFGEGPRICIGIRFGMMQTKVGLTVLLKHYKFTVSPKTPSPLIMNPKSFILSTDGGMWLDYEKI